MDLNNPTFMPIIASLFTGALAVNAFFLKGLVSKINQIDGIERLLSNHHIQFSTQIQNLQNQITGLTTQVNAVADLRARIAVLEYASNKSFDLLQRTSNLSQQEEKN